MSKQTEALKLALEHAKRDERHMNNAETRYWCRMYRDIAEKTIEALAEQPAQQQEAFGHVTVRRLSRRFENHHDQYHFYPAGQSPYLDNVDECHAVYTSPPASKPWVGLTDEERGQAINANFGTGLWAMAKDIEAKLREKNA